MQHAFRRTRRALTCLVALAALGAAVVPGMAQAASKPDVTVMTRNLYLGSSLDPATSATTPLGFIQGVAQIYGTVQFTDFPTRANALANEIAGAKPDLVGLQEVSIWTTSPITGRAVPPPGYEFLQILQSALQAKGLDYDAVSIANNADIGPAPLLTGNATPPDCGLFSVSPLIPDCVVRLQDRDVILVNRDRAGLSTSNPQSGRYAAQATIPLPTGGTESFDRGWASVDVSLDGSSFRFFNTHLEVEGATGPIQEAQGDEALGIIKDPSRTQPVVVVGDFNSAADGSTTATYRNLLRGGLKDVWAAANGNKGYSCCQNQTLTNTASEAGSRIDLVLTYGKFAAKSAALTGSTPFRSQTQPVPRPIWASDHFGVAATVK